MAEEKRKRRGDEEKRSSRADGRKRASTNGDGRKLSPANGDGRKRASRRRNGRPNAAKVAGAARRAIAELMGHAPEAVSGIQRDDDGWLVTVEFVELERIPQSTDVMATYEVELDGSGELTGYRRTRRYVRSQAEG